MQQWVNYLCGFILAAWWSVGAAATPGSEAWRVNAERTGACALESTPVTVNDGYLDTPVRLRFTGGTLRVLTESNIDLQGQDLGVQVDDNAPVPFSALEGKTDVLVGGDLDAVVEQFVRGREAGVKLRFWPSWPVTGTKTATFSLIGFTKAWNQFETCR